MRPFGQEQTFLRIRFVHLGSRQCPITERDGDHGRIRDSWRRRDFQTRIHIRQIRLRINSFPCVAILTYSVTQFKVMLRTTSGQTYDLYRKNHDARASEDEPNKAREKATQQRQ